MLVFSTGRSLGLYSIPQGRLLWEQNIEVMFGLSFSHDSHSLGVGGFGSWRTVDVASAKILQQFNGHAGPATSISFSPDAKIAVSAGLDGTVRFWDTALGTELAKFVSLKDGSWAVVDPTGRYDASDPDGVDGLHWVVDTDVISLNQLKQRFYVPGLLAKVIRRDKLPDVADLHLVDLFPGVQYQPPAIGSTKLEVTMKNRGGGIGPIKVLVNGKEVAAGDTPHMCSRWLFQKAISDAV